MSHNDVINQYFRKSPDLNRKNWKKGEYLCREGGDLELLHYLESGRFRVFRSLHNGREILYRIYLPGSLIGDVEVFTGSESASCSVQCIEPAVTLGLPMDLIRKNPEKSAQLIFELGRGIARKLHENSVSEALNTAYPLETRLAHYYLSFTDPALRAQNLGQLSDWMGCSYRHLTRSLAHLKECGAISRSASGITPNYKAADTGILKAIAEPIILEERGRTLFEPGDH